MRLFSNTEINALPAETRAFVVNSISSTVLNGYDEKGNYAFTTESLSQTKIFKRIANTDLLISVNFAADDYPSFNVCVVQATDEEFKSFIRTELEGWVVKKCQFEDVVIGSDNCVASLCGFQIVNEESENFEHESFEIIESEEKAKKMLSSARESQPESTWKMISIYDEDHIENASYI